MKGDIYRVTYNFAKKEAELHMVDGSIKTVPMDVETWNSLLQGNIIENFKKYLNE